MSQKQEGQRQTRVKLILGIFMQIDIFQYQVWSWFYIATHIDYNRFRRYFKETTLIFWINLNVLRLMCEAKHLTSFAAGYFSDCYGRTEVSLLNISYVHSFQELKWI